MTVHESLRKKLESTRIALLENEHAIWRVQMGSLPCDADRLELMRSAMDTAATQLEAVESLLAGWDRPSGGE